MEPVTLTAGTIASLIFSKALEKGGEQLGEAVSDKIAQLLKVIREVIREKFKSKGMEGILTQAQDNPIETNKSVFKTVLETQMEDDEVFAQKLKALMDELKSDEQVNQIFFKGVKVKGGAEIGDVEQTATPGGSVRQEAVTEVEVGGDLKIGNMKQRG